MFLRVMPEADLGLELLPAILVSKLPNVPSGLPRFAPISSFDHISTATKGTKSTTSGNQGRVLVGDELADDGSATVRVL